MTLFQLRLLILWAAMAMCGGLAHASVNVNVNGFGHGSRVSAIAADTLPADSRYIPFILAAAKETKVDAALIRAVIAVESGFNPSARSSAGAVGLMQLMPGTAKQYGVTDRLDPAQNIHGGARHLRRLKGMFGNNLRLVLAAYNAGEQTVKKYGRRIPPYRETAAYVPKVLSHYRKFRAAAPTAPRG